jgi:LEA14-like dessication related protein
MVHSSRSLLLNRQSSTFWLISILLLSQTFNSCLPKKDIELRQIKSMVGDVSDEPMLKAEVVFFNPNPQQGVLKHIKADVYVAGKKAAVVDQKVKIKVPANGEFTIPMEIKINLKEQGVMNTLLSLLGAKKIKVRYKGHVKVLYRGLPLRVPIDREEEVRVRL